jgi:hypothetical protein
MPVTENKEIITVYHEAHEHARGKAEIIHVLELTFLNAVSPEDDDLNSAPYE